MPSDNTLHGGYEYYSYEHEWKIDECIVSLIKGFVDMPMGIEKNPPMADDNQADYSGTLHKVQ